MEEETKVEQVEEKPQEKKKVVMPFLQTTLNGMAYGLFATLIIGTIFGTIGQLFHYGAGNGFCDFMYNIIGDGKGKGLAFVLQCLTGAGIGIGVALALKLNVLQIIVLAAVGECAAYFSLTTAFVETFTYSDTFKIGDPLTIYLVVISTALLMKLVFRKKTPVDILIIPLFGVAVGFIASLLIRYPTIYVTYGIQWVIDKGTTITPFFMGIVIAVLMGMALTAPISSAAIGAMVLADISLPGVALASGAAIVGCCTQMVGFAIQSRKDNNIGTIISIGIGTSMLQFKNILKKPIIWLPTIIASAILGPISTCLVKVVCGGASSGMGTAGFVGQIGTISSMLAQNSDVWRIVVGIVVLELVAPAILVFLIDLLFRKFKWIKDGDFKI